MSLKQVYGREFRNHLGYHAAWQPGAAIAPGDIGRLKEGLFVREGTLQEVARDLKTPTEDIPQDAPWKFSVGVSLSVDAKAQAKLDPSLSLDGSLKFASKGGVVFDAQNIVQSRVTNLQNLLNSIPWTGESWDDRILVTEVILAKRVGVAIAESGDADVAVKGKAKALEMFDMADASVAFGATTGATFSMALRTGKTPYVVGLRLYRRSRLPFSGKGTLLGVRKPETGEPVVYEELSVFEPGL